MEVVKGVERKLEGSQVQLASGVSDLKQQIQKVWVPVTLYAKWSIVIAYFPPNFQRTYSKLYEQI